MRIPVKIKLIGMKPLILIGGGGHCKSVIEAAESAGREIRGILDLPEYNGTECLGYKIIGSDDDIPKLVDDCEFIVTLGFIKNPAPRIRLHRLVVKHGGNFATVIASTAHVSRHAAVGDGTVILHHATVNAGARIGFGCIINTASNIEHDVTVKDFCHISTGAMINGDCTLGESCFIGSGSVVANGVSMADGCIVGAGSMVYKDIHASGTYAGTPARRISE